MLMLAALTIVALLLRLACATGLIGSDDLAYSCFAQRIAHGTYQLLPNHFAIRFGLILPVGALFRIVGVSEWSAISIPLLASTLSVPVLVLIGRRLFTWHVGLIAGVLYATFPLQLRYASILVPEPVAEFLVLLAVLCYLHADERRWALYSIAGLILGVAYLTKEPALLVVPALMFDAIARRRWREAMLIALGAVVVISIELSYYSMHGDLLFRPHAMTLHESSTMALSANEDLRYRLTKAYPNMMLIPSLDFGLHSLVCLAGTAVALLAQRRAGYRLTMAWAVIPWLYLNFGSSSLTRYFVLPVAPRYIAFTYPPLMLMAGVVLARGFATRRMVALGSGLVIALVATVGLVSGLATQGRGYRAPEMTVLREIVRRTPDASSVTIRAEIPQWESALRILGAATPRDAEQPADFVVRPDPVGLPALHKPRTASDAAQSFLSREALAETLLCLSVGDIASTQDNTRIAP